MVADCVPDESVTETVAFFAPAVVGRNCTVTTHDAPLASEVALPSWPPTAGPQVDKIGTMVYSEAFVPESTPLPTPVTVAPVLLVSMKVWHGPPKKQNKPGPTPCVAVGLQLAGLNAIDPPPPPPLQLPPRPPWNSTAPTSKHDARPPSGRGFPKKSLFGCGWPVGITSMAGEPAARA